MLSPLLATDHLRFKRCSPRWANERTIKARDERHGPCSSMATLSKGLCEDEPVTQRRSDTLWPLLANHFKLLDAWQNWCASFLGSPQRFVL